MTHPPADPSADPAPADGPASLDAKAVGEVFGFVIDELVRFSSMNMDGLKAIDQQDFFCSIPHPGRGQRLIGREAYDRLRVLAGEALNQSPYRRRVDPDEAFNKVLAGFGRMIFAERFTGSTDGEDLDNLQAWISEAGSACRTLTHLIPCNIGLSRGASVTIGPVTFEAREDAMSRLRSTFEAWTTDRKDQGRTTADREIARTTRYFEAFLDVARVEVSECDPRTSSAVAKEAVQVALDYIHLMAGAAHTRKMRLGGPAIAGDSRAAVALDADGAPHLGWSSNWGGAHIDDSFWIWLVADEQKAMTEAVGVTIAVMLERRDLQMIAARYRDAAAWYADAARETRTAAAVAKYLTAMERLLWTGKQGHITTRLAERVAALCFSVQNWDFETLVQKVRAAYDLRSGILHGEYPADDPRIVANYRLCEALARDVIMSWLQRYGAGFDRETTLEKMRAHLDGFVAEVKTATAKRAEEPPPLRRDEPDRPALDRSRSTVLPNPTRPRSG